MMNTSKRAKRMARHHKARKQPPLNLVSLMDIFTILVFFLLVSSSSAPQLPNSKDLRLPSSVAKKAPKETLLITVTEKDILVQGRKIAAVNDILQNENLLINTLKEELLFHSSKNLINQRIERTKKRAATIIGDENIPYELLRKILETCRQANYTQIAFAAMQKVKT